MAKQVRSTAATPLAGMSVDERARWLAAWFLGLGGDFVQVERNGHLWRKIIDERSIVGIVRAIDPSLTDTDIQSTYGRMRKLGLRESDERTKGAPGRFNRYFRVDDIFTAPTSPEPTPLEKLHTRAIEEITRLRRRVTELEEELDKLRGEPEIDTGSASAMKLRELLEDLKD